MQKTIYKIFFISLIAFSAHGQTFNAFMNAAQEAMEDKDFYNAAYYYKTAMEFDTSNLEVRYNYGEAAKMFSAFSIAKEQFEYVKANDADNMYPKAVFNLAETQQMLGEYNEAKRNYELFISENNNEDEFLTAKAEKEKEAIDWAKSQVEQPSEGVTFEKLDTSINTPYSEFSPTLFEDKLYYASHRFTQNEEDRRINRLFSKVLSAQEGQTGELIGEDFNGSGDHIGNLTFNTDKTKVIYTKCSYVNSTDIRCDLYSRSIDEDGNWSSEMIMQDGINADGYTTTQPALAYDVNLDKEILYFVSDRENGKGGLDIWYSILVDETYSTPENLESINTASDEMTPFYHSQSSTLYFSSDGRMGMGGFDIYSSSKTDNDYEVPVNIGYPRNSSFNDLYYYLNDEGTEAYMSSNRIGSYYLDDSYEACCYDIYKADIEELFVDLTILTFNEATLEELPGAHVFIIDPVTGDTLYDSHNPDGNDHLFKLNCNKEYIIVTEKDGYESNTTSIRTNNCKELEEIIRKIYLKPLPIKLDVYTFDQSTLEALPGTTVKLFDLSNPEADPIIVVDENGNYYQFDIIAGGRYELVAEKRGYETIRQIVNSNDVRDGIVTEKLYLPVRKILIDEYLPVTVYYDNDRPNRRSKKMYTDLSYSDTYGPYLDKLGEFQRCYSKGLKGQEKESAEYEMSEFFRSEVEAGYNKLQMFLSRLHERLEAGDIIEISIKGFASPRAPNKYNLALGQRRIWTLKNEIITFKGGLLSPYVESGKLRVVEISFGEEIAPNGISDSYTEPIQSIYSIRASRERKAEIVRVRILN